MLNYPIHLRQSQPVAVAEGYDLTNEGSALVVVTGGDGEIAVKPSTGAAGERFFGVNVNQTQHPDFLPKIENFDANLNSTTRKLSRKVADNGSLRVVAGTTVLTAGDGTTAGTYSLGADGQTLTLPTAQKDAPVAVGYRFVPSIMDVREIQGDQDAGRTASALLGITTVIDRGEIETTEYDTAVAWSPDSVVRLGANGLFTTAGSGTVLSNVFVGAAPAEAHPFLKLVLK